jgi:processive 1,2-diacylglycerol beta-glucosyltransferase
MSKPPQKHIVVLSASAGAGHVRAAQALCETASRDFPHLRITHIDVLDLVPKNFRKLYFDSYLKLIEKMPLLWAYLYQHTDRAADKSKISTIRKRLERLNTRKLYSELERLAPDAIVCTHFLAPELLSRRIARGKLRTPVWVQVTDFDVHALWIHPHMSGYCVANEEVAWRLAQRGIDSRDVHVTGIPIAPQFSESLDARTCAQELGLDPDVTTLLMMAGGAGVGGIETLVERLAELQSNPDQARFQIVALAGKNEKLLAELQSIAQRYPGIVFPMGFTRTIERAMAAADLAITKPGGLTTSECLAMQLPMILVAPIPGQEERNADYLLESGVAMKAPDAAALEYKLMRLLAAPEWLESMRRKMREIARPDAAARVLSIISTSLDAS